MDEASSSGFGKSTCVGLKKIEQKSTILGKAALNLNGIATAKQEEKHAIKHYLSGVLRKNKTSK